MGVIYKLQKDGTTIALDDSQEFTVNFKNPCELDDIQHITGTNPDTTNLNTVYVASDATEINYNLNPTAAITQTFVFSIGHTDENLKLCNTGVKTSDITDCTNKGWNFL